MVSFTCLYDKVSQRKSADKENCETDIKNLDHGIPMARAANEIRYNTVAVSVLCFNIKITGNNLIQD